jgi:hypothetical protein
LFFARNVFKGEKRKNKKYAITKGINIWLNSFSTIAITVMPITDIKNFVAESRRTLFAIIISGRI